MSRPIALLVAVLGLAGGSLDPAPDLDILQGEWNCGQVRLEIKEDQYQYRTERIGVLLFGYSLPDDIHTLYLADGREIRLTKASETSVTLLGDDGQETTCTRVAETPSSD